MMNDAEKHGLLWSVTVCSTPRFYQSILRTLLTAIGLLVSNIFRINSNNDTKSFKQIFFRWSNTWQTYVTVLLDPSWNTPYASPEKLRASSAGGRSPLLSLDTHEEKKKNTQWNKQPAVQNSRWEVKIWKWRLTHSSISTPPVETPAWWGPVCASRVPSAVSSPPRSDGHRGDWMRKLFNNRRHFLQKRILKLVWSSSSLKATGHIDIKQDIKQTRTVDFDHQHVHWTCIRKRSYLRLNIYS